VPDSNGKTLPLDASSGQVHWSTHSLPDRGLIGRVEQVDLQSGMSMTAACGQCCGDTVAWGEVTPDTVTGLIGDSGQFAAFEVDVDCYQNHWSFQVPNGGGSGQATWSSDDPSVATCDGNGIAVATGGGDTRIHARWDAIENFESEDGSYCIQQTTPMDTWANCDVQVPTSLQVLNVNVLPDGSGPPNGCPGSANYGIRVDIKYLVLDQNSPPRAILSANMTPHEMVTLFDGETSDNDIGPVPGYPTSSHNTAPDGTFHDVPFGLCSNFPIAGKNATQRIRMIWNGISHEVRFQQFTVQAPGSASFGHGTITNFVFSPGFGQDISASR
jgi:hypothetical protein